MDQLKTALAVLKKHHFWVLCGLIVVVSLGVWWMATGTLAEKFTTNKGTLEGAFQEMQTLGSHANHPNDKVIAAIEERTDRQKEIVFRFWDQLYREQKKKNKLPDTLSDEFKREFERMERLDVEYLEEHELDATYREEYQEFIGGHFKKLFEEDLNIRRRKDAPQNTPAGETAARRRDSARRTDPMDMMSPARGRNPSRPGDSKTNSGSEMIGIVEWDEENRVQIEQRFHWRTAPSTELLRMRQEDLWVYGALVRIIRNMNDGATGPYNATVKRIVALEIGQDAVRSWEESKESVLRMASGFEDNAAALGQQEGEARYVDDQGKLLLPEDAPPYAEFKMMPIRMKLEIDQKKIPQLLIECANSDMPVEVRKVRLNPGKGTQLDPGQLAAKDKDNGRATSGGHGLVGEATASSLVIPIEIHGIICIYNRPDEEELGTGAASETPAETAPAAPPASEESTGTPADDTTTGQTEPTSAEQPPAANP